MRYALYAAAFLLGAGIMAVFLVSVEISTRAQATQGGRIQQVAGPSIYALQIAVFEDTEKKRTCYVARAGTGIGIDCP